jgi:Predicted ATP-dependent endonuclease of the OLD family
MFRILSATFHNFRALRDVTVPLELKAVLVGPNNVGKTSVLDGIEYSLGVGRRSFNFDERDVSTGSDPAQGFVIDLTLGPTAGDRLTRPEVELFGTHIDVVAGAHRLFVQVTGRREDDDGVFRTRVRYAKADGKDDGPVTAVERQALGVLLLPAIRDARHEFGERGGLWSRLGSEAEISAEAEDRLAALGADVGEAVVSEILGADLATTVADMIGETVGTILYAGQGTSSLDYSATAIDPTQALRQIDLRLTTPHQTSGSRIADHSVGTQSVALFGLFGAYAASMRERVMTIAIEEPEAHLHPHATRALVKRVLAEDAQVIVTTHSTSVTDAADPRSIVRLRRTGDRTEAHAIANDLLTDREVRTIRRMISDVGSDFLFARAVLLAEGLSERLALPMIAARLGFDFDLLGVSIVRVEGDRFGAFSKLLGPSGLAIPFARLSDLNAAPRLIRDARREGVLPAATGPADPAASRAAAAAAGWFWWSEGDLEDVLLSVAGGARVAAALVDIHGPSIFERFANGSKVLLPAPVEDDHPFLRAVLGSKAVSKPLVAQRVAEMIADDEVPVEGELAEVISYVADLAISEARAAVVAVDAVAEA